MRAMRRAAVILPLLLAVLAAAGWAALRATLPATDGEHVLTGLSAPVAVTRDAGGVPTVRGATRADVARATGFVHAQDRFFQMDLLRRATAGELSVLFGSKALDADRRFRRHGLRAVAQQALAALPPSHRAVLDAYVEGVNAGLEALTVHPPEYLLLRTDPEDWRAEDTLLVVLAMFKRLSYPTADGDARRGMLVECLPPAAAAFLSSDDPEWAAPLDEGELETVPLPTPDQYDLSRLPDLNFDVDWPFEESVNRDTELPGGASNAWAVAGSYTEDGRALLANDMHLGQSMPNIWYRMRLVVDEPAAPVDVTGVTLPGGPVIVAGSNGRVAWGFTNSYADVSDRVQLAPVDGNALAYRTPAGEVMLEQREERIAIKGEDAVIEQFRWSEFGPVIDDWRGRPVAIRWSGHDPDALDLRILDMEQAASATEALGLGARMAIPPQNLVVADADGHIGWTVAGRIPARRPGYDPKLPHDSDAAGAGWSGWLDPARYPQVLDPPGGRIWTANNHIVTGDALALLGDALYWHGARARQIRDRLRDLDSASEQDMLNIQLDDEARLYKRWHRLLSDLAGLERISTHPRGGEFQAVLAGWSGHASADSAAYRFVHAFRARVRDVAFTALTAPCRKVDPDFRFEGFRQQEGVLWTLVTTQPVHLKHPGYASWDAMLEAVAVETLEYFAASDAPLAGHSWGAHNVVNPAHPLSLAVPALGRLLNVGPDPGDGDRYLPRVQAFGNGASERFAVRPGREAAGYFHMPGGQSGNPVSRWYRHGHREWLEGRPTPFLPGAEAHRLTLRP